jgi:ubiquinone/menaquinone biosynthesis C-methylase UbiE
MTRRSILYLIGTFLLLGGGGCSDFAREHMNSAERDAWQQPKAVIQSLKISPGARVADLGAGGGYFTFRLAEAVGPAGKAYAVDIDRGALDFIAQRAREQGIANVEVVQAAENDPRLPGGGFDLIFTYNTVHHLGNRAAYFRSLARALRPDGRIAIIDYTPTGFAWLFGHGTAKEVIRQETESAGYRLTDDFDYLAKQHFQVFRRD